MKRIQKRSLLAGMIFLLMLLSLAGCQKSNSINGKWEEPVSGVTMEIAEGGQLLMTLHGTTFTMSYELQDPNVLIIKASEDGSIPDQKMTYTVNEDKLTITVDGVDTVFNRVKK